MKALTNLDVAAGDGHGGAAAVPGAPTGKTGASPAPGRDQAWLPDLLSTTVCYVQLCCKGAIDAFITLSKSESPDVDGADGASQDAGDGSAPSATAVAVQSHSVLLTGFWDEGKSDEAGVLLHALCADLVSGQGR